MKYLLSTLFICLIPLIFSCKENGADYNLECDFSYDTNYIFDRVPMQFNNNTTLDGKTSNKITYKWEFGDKSTSTEKNPIHTFKYTGKYMVKLTAYFEELTDVRTIEILVKTQPDILANFLISKSKVYQGDSVYFKNNSLNYTKCLWKMADEFTTTEINPSYAFNTVGSKRITLIVENETKKDSISKLIWVESLRLPKSNFKYPEGLLYINEPIQFQNQAINGVKYSWDFGDGTSSIDVSPLHTYVKVGEYDVKLTTYNFRDVKHDTIKKIKIIKSQIDFTPKMGTKNTAVTLFGEFKSNEVENVKLSNKNLSFNIINSTNIKVIIPEKTGTGIFEIELKNGTKIVSFEKFIFEASPINDLSEINFTELDTIIDMDINDNEEMIISGKDKTGKSMMLKIDTKSENNYYPSLDNFLSKYQINEKFKGHIGITLNNDIDYTLEQTPYIFTWKTDNYTNGNFDTTIYQIASGAGLNHYDPGFYYYITQIRAYNNDLYFGVYNSDPSPNFGASILKYSFTDKTLKTIFHYQSSKDNPTSLHVDQSGIVSVDANNIDKGVNLYSTVDGIRKKLLTNFSSGKYTNFHIARNRFKKNSRTIISNHVQKKIYIYEPNSYFEIDISIPIKKFVVLNNDDIIGTDGIKLYKFSY